MTYQMEKHAHKLTFTQELSFVIWKHHRSVNKIK